MPLDGAVDFPSKILHRIKTVSVLEEVVYVTTTLTSQIVIHFVYDYFAEDPKQRWGAETVVTALNFTSASTILTSLVL